MNLLEFSVDINNDTNLISSAFDVLFDLLRGVTDTLHSIKIFANVSLFDILIAVSVMSIVITYLINIAKRPNVTFSNKDKGHSKNEK